MYSVEPWMLLLRAAELAVRIALVTAFAPQAEDPAEAEPDPDPKGS
jgi:hypothetical protein